MMTVVVKIKAAFLILICSAMACQVQAHDNGDDSCHRQVKKMAGLVKTHHKLSGDITAAKAELQALKNKGESLSEDETLRVSELENSIKNLKQELDAHMEAINSKSERVVNNCPD